MTGIEWITKRRTTFFIFPGSNKKYIIIYDDMFERFDFCYEELYL